MVMWTNQNAYDGIINSASIRYGVPVSIIKGVIAAESGFQADAKREEDFSNRRPPSDWPPGVTVDASRGLMQVLCWRARTLGHAGSCDALYDPYTNINLGVKLLAQLHAQTGSWSDAISAYNGGLRPELGFGAQRGGRYRNQDYVDRVNRYATYFTTGEMPPEGGFALKAGLGALAGVALLGFFLGQVGGWDGVQNWHVLTGTGVGTGALALALVDLRRRVIHLEKLASRCLDRARERTDNRS